MAGPGGFRKRKKSNDQRAPVISYYLRDGPLFFPGGYRDFWEAGNFFPP